jgi:hypothetical protein
LLWIVADAPVVAYVDPVDQFVPDHAAPFVAVNGSVNSGVDVPVPVRRMSPWYAP